MTPVHLGRYDNSWYDPGGSSLGRALWFFLGLPVLRSGWLPSSEIRCRLLRWFGGRVGTGVVIKPGTRVKYPWLLEIGNDTWIGEDAWLDNLALVRVGSNVCISQGVYVCTGNHDWSDPAFGLLIRPVTIRDGAWIGARAILCPGVEVGECAVASAGSVVMGDLRGYGIYAGNPAVEIKSRVFRTGAGEREGDPVAPAR